MATERKLIISLDSKTVVLLLETNEEFDTGSGLCVQSSDAGAVGVAVAGFSLKKYKDYTGVVDKRWLDVIAVFEKALREESIKSFKTNAEKRKARGKK